MKFVINIFLFTCLFLAPLSAGNFTGRSLESLNGDIEYYEEEISSLWHISLNTGKAKLFRKTTTISRITSISVHRFDNNGYETEHCIFRPRNSAVATIELSADGTDPVIANDSIDMTIPSERTLYAYLGDGRVAASHWESRFGIEQFIGTDTSDLNEVTFPPGLKYAKRDSSGTKHFHFNDHGCLSKIENDRNDGTISITVYDNYRYDSYGNWIERKRYALRPEGSRIHTASERRRYRYR